MKLWKKLLASVGVAGAMAMQPAQAANTPFLFMQLLSADASGNNAVSLGLWDMSQISAPGANSITLKGYFNGWVLNTQVQGTLTGVLPLNLTITGAAYRQDVSGVALSGAPSGWTADSQGNFTNIVNDNCSGTKKTNFGTTAVNCGRQDGVNDPYTTPTPFLNFFNGASATNNETLKVRLGLANWPNPAFAGGTKVTDDLKISSTPINGATSTSQADVGGGIQNLGTITGNGSTVSTVLISSLVSPLNLVFGFDLTSSSLQNPTDSCPDVNGTACVNGNQFDFTNTITQVPEPGTLALLGLALVGVAAVRRKQAVAA